MKIAQIQFTPWDKVYDFSYGELDLKKDDTVIVETELGTEMGKVVDLTEKTENTENMKPVIRKATLADFEKTPTQEEKKEALDYCQDMINKHNLSMKLIDVHFSFTNSRATFAFISDGRVDFRELVKDLTIHFNRTIRMHQVGIRDGAKMMGDCGPCGRTLCCKKFLNNFSSITSDMAEVQQVVHRGSDRISGICGRLMCCLAYEEDGYKELSEKLPPIGTKVNVDGEKGIVVGHHILKQAVNVQFKDEKTQKTKVVEVDLNRHKK